MADDTDTQSSSTPFTADVSPSETSRPPPSDRMPTNSHKTSTKISPGLQLFVKSGLIGGGQIFPLETFPIVVGRNAQCQLQLADAQVSRQHSRFDLTEGQLTITDLQSRNGTLVNSRRIAAPVPLVAGDRLIIGRTSLEVMSTTSTVPITAEATTHELTQRSAETHPHVGSHTI